MSSLNLLYKFSLLSFQIWSVQKKGVQLNFCFSSAFIDFFFCSSVHVGFCVFIWKLCLCGLIVLNVLWEFEKVTDSLIAQPFHSWSVDCITQVLCVFTVHVAGVRRARAGADLRPVLCSVVSSDFSALSVLAFLRGHTAPGRPFLTITGVPTGFPGGSVVKKYSCNSGELGLTPGSRRPPEKGMATHSIILAWKIQGEEPGGLQSMGSQRTTDWLPHTHAWGGPHLVTYTHTHTHTRGMGLVLWFSHTHTHVKWASSWLGFALGLTFAIPMLWPQISFGCCLPILFWMLPRWIVIVVLFFT